jgi:poly(3-hydroxybutyrate) depolymerase
MTIRPHIAIVLLTGLLGCLPGCMITQSQDTPVDHEVQENPVTDTDYYIYVPSTYNRSKKYPLVITLHGTWPWDTAWHQIREWKALAEEKQFIVVVPKLDSAQGILPVGDSSLMEHLAEDEQEILSLRRLIVNRYSVDEKKILLTGFSAGGLPMFYVGLRHPEKFQMLIGRAVNSDERALASVEHKITPKTRRIPVVLIIGKDDPALQKSSWQALGWLRRHGWTSRNSDRDAVRGGHLRRPETAYTHWNP